LSYGADKVFEKEFFSVLLGGNCLRIKSSSLFKNTGMSTFGFAQQQTLRSVEHFVQKSNVPFKRFLSSPATQIYGLTLISSSTKAESLEKEQKPLKKSLSISFKLIAPRSSTDSF
jgi:hypothetical protein